MELLRKSETSFGEGQLSLHCAHPCTKPEKRRHNCPGTGRKQNWQQLVQKPLFLERTRFLKPTEQHNRAIVPRVGWQRILLPLGIVSAVGWKGAAENHLQPLQKLCSVHHYTREQGQQPSKLTSTFFLFSSYSQ